MFGIHDFIISILVVSRLENLNLILKFDLVKGPKC
jgi:transposase InsO family protein